MAKTRVSTVIAAYLAIQEQEQKAKRTRSQVADLVLSGRMTAGDVADLIGITESGVNQIVMRKRAGMYDNV